MTTITRARRWIERLDQEAEEFANEVARALRRAIRAGTSKLGQVLVAQGEPAEPITSVDDLAAIETAWRAEVTNTVIPAVERFMRAGADHALEELAAETPVLLNMRHPAAELHIAQAENRLRGIGTDLWQRTRDQLIIGFQEGEAIPELSKRVSEVIASSEDRARTIARTEVISASNAGALAQVRLLGDAAPVAKTWLSTNDRRTRASHRFADGQTVALDDAFAVGGASLDFPGDPTGPPDEVINCRCTITWEMGEIFARDPLTWLSFHLGGKHDQSAHGGGGKGAGGGADFEPVEFKTPSGEFSKSEAQKFGEEGWSDWRGEMSPGQRRAIENYTSDQDFSHYNVNAYLRGYNRRGGSKPPPKSAVEGKIRTLDAAMAHPSAKAPADMVVHRGMQGALAQRIVDLHGEGRLITDFEGAKIRDHGFPSTSLNPATARQFATGGGLGRGTDRVVLNVQVRQGQRAIMPGPLARQHQGELEVILPRGQTYEVTGARRGRGVLEVDVRILDE